ncbi:hypothetical protein EIP86_003492 [Pleurotus ostreatoroseus]|nr:hypothetical protein EIP86_003492 [Pleurotus ostreatoroseus]
MPHADAALGSAMRMVKLFGWEAKMSERIDNKRQEELKIIRKFRILTLISNNISEVLDAFANTALTQTTSTEAEDDLIGIRAASFTWNKDTSGNSTPSSIRRNFKLQIDKDVFFKRGHINLVIGQTASGKTSLLMALLGEMHYIPMGPDSLVSLPRKKGVAYHAQESWVLNETIRVRQSFHQLWLTLTKPVP